MGYQLIPGDCIEVMSAIQRDSIDITITSPPYNMGKKQWAMGYQRKPESRQGIEYKAHGDNMSQQAYEQWQVDVLNAIHAITAPGGSLFYNHKTRTLKGCLIHPMDWIRKSGWTIRQEIIWDRMSTHNHEPSLFWPVDERIYWLTKGKARLNDINISLPSVWREFGPTPGTWHPAPFTILLPRMILKAMKIAPGATVLDPFAGSGTTIKAALEIGCNAIGIDVCNEYLIRADQEIRNAPAQPDKTAIDTDSLPLFAFASG